MSIAGNGRSAPVAMGRAFLVFAALPATWLAAGPPQISAPPDFAQSGPPNQAEGKALIERFREAEEFPPYLEFDLHQLPRRGEEHLYHGRMWSWRNGQGRVLRIELNPTGPDERRFLVQDGAEAAAWVNAGPAPAPRRVEPFEPLVPGVEITPFDLEMPFLFWTDARLLGVTRISNRPANLFIFRPPAGFVGPRPDFRGVRAYLDTQYNAPVRTELIGQNDQPLKTLSLVDLKKVGGKWFPKDFDVRNEATRDKTRLSVTAAGMDLSFNPGIFLPAALVRPVEPPSADRLVRIGP